MNAEIFSEWLKRQGHTVYKTESSYWYDAGPRVLQAFPYHWLIQPSHSELNKLMAKNGIVALRYSTPIEAPTGMISYHVVLKNPYNLETLRAQARNGVKRGLLNFRIEQISFDRLADEGWILQHDTLERQGRIGSMTKDEWVRICSSAKDLAGFEAWGAISATGELAAALITSRIEDTFCVPYALNLRKFLQDHVNNAIFYFVACELLSREEISSIFYTVQSLDAPESVDEFKFRMNLIPKPVRQCAVFHPAVKPIANHFTHSIFLNLLKRFPNNHVVAKGEGMLRFYLKGLEPLKSQDWPKCLEEHRSKLLEELG
jgi:hypothetical protein